MRNGALDVLHMLVDWRETLKTISASGCTNFFFDFVPDEADGTWKPTSCYAAEESAAMQEVFRLMTLSAEAPWSTDEEFITSGWPERIAPAAYEALDLMRARGWFSDDKEEDIPSGKIPDWLREVRRPA